MAKTRQVRTLQRCRVSENDLPEELQRHRWEVGARIRRIRRERGLSQVQLAAAIGIDHRTISRIENGRHATSIDLIYRLAAGLGVPSWQFFKDDE